MRSSGILCPLFSLASRFGIGCISREAYDFIDFLEMSGQSYWQILPIGPTGYGNSPYQPVSAFAGNPYFISPEALIEKGLLSHDDCNLFFGADEEKVDYGALYENRLTLLRIAYHNFVQANGPSDSVFVSFCESEKEWLDDYAIFCAIKEENNGASWQDWPTEYKEKKATALNAFQKEHTESIGFYRFLQYEFTLEWNKLREYAASKKVRIIGDIPFYVAMDSSDVWAHPEVFQMSADLEPLVVAGCAPDAFSATGQLWGNPIYDWDRLKKARYAWWVRRMARSYELYDVIRIDHFHGFTEYYAVPYGQDTAEKGTSHPGPGLDFFRILEEELGPISTEEGVRIIAEDLGTVTKENQVLLAKTGIPGMKILQYAFTSWDSLYLPYKHEHNCVVYTGTHDNMTSRNWLDCINDGERSYLRRYLNSMNSDYGGLVWDLIREAYRSVGDLCIIPIQDYLVKGYEARINTPGAPDGNWEWRLKPNFLSNELASSIRLLAETYGRIN